MRKHSITEAKAPYKATAISLPRLSLTLDPLDHIIRYPAVTQVHGGNHLPRILMFRIKSRKEKFEVSHFLYIVLEPRPAHLRSEYALLYDTRKHFTEDGKRRSNH